MTVAGRGRRGGTRGAARGRGRLQEATRGRGGPRGSTWGHKEALGAARYRGGPWGRGGPRGVLRGHEGMREVVGGCEGSRLAVGGFYWLYMPSVKIIKNWTSQRFQGPQYKLKVLCIMFADNLALPAPCRAAMQEMITIYADYCEMFCLSFNVKKSKVMFFGKPICDMSIFAPLLLNNCAIEYVTNWKYLGATIISGKCFGFSSKSDLASFYRASNSVLNVLTKPSEQILLVIVYKLCTHYVIYLWSERIFCSGDVSVQCGSQ